MKHLLICLVVLLGVTSISAQTRRPQNAELKIGIIDNDAEYLDCGCYFSAGGKYESYNFLADMDGAKVRRAWININGRVTPLKFVSSTEGNKPLKKGSSYVETYRSSNITARVTYVVTIPNRLGDEIIKYAATIVVTKGNNSKTFKAVGECGC
ncbi:MAG: hypothetical protein H0X72_14290 [Acidobacteria bacterium]|jgi:hypothetical protein|nr:hypothetical protein [Acidobacteriota bacterium]